MVHRHVFNPLVAGSTRIGLSLAGSRVLEVKGRKSGEWRQTPVNPLEFEGGRYLVAPRGNTQWVRNMRVSGGGRLVRGARPRSSPRPRSPRPSRPPLLRAYLKKWKWEVGAFFDGVGPDSSDEELLPHRPRPPGLPHRPARTRSMFPVVETAKIDLALEEAAGAAARRARKKMTPQLTAMIPISRRTICSASDSWVSAGSASKSISPSSRWAAPVRAPSAMKETTRGRIP